MRDAFYVGPDEVREYLEIAGSDGKDVGTALKEDVTTHGEWALQEYSESGLLPQPELTGFGWLNLAELRENLAQAEVAMQELSPPYLAVIAAMESLAAWVGAEKVRLVFWLAM